MRSRYVFVLLAALAACGGSGATDTAQKLAMGITSGNNQVVTAGATQLDPVVAQVVRNSTGSLTLRVRRETPADRLLDLVVPRLFAQTVVNGSPVPGAVVCAAGGDGGLTPFTPCTNTDSGGKATFFFTPSTVAGDHTSEIRGTVANQPAVFDTAKAIVQAGPVNPNYRTSAVPIQTFPATVAAYSVQDAYGNPIPFRIVPDEIITVQDTTVGSVGARTITGITAASTQSDRIVELRGVGGVLLGHARYSATTTQLLGWIAAGTNTTP